MRNDGLGKAPRAELYLLATIAPIVNPMQVVVRSSLPPPQLISGIRRAVQTVDRTLAMHDVRTMNEIAFDSLQLERVSSLMMALFALAALVMARSACMASSPMRFVSARSKWERAWRWAQWAGISCCWS